VNGVELPAKATEELEEKPVQQEKLKVLFRAKTLLIRSLIIFFNWYV